MSLKRIQYLTAGEKEHHVLPVCHAVFYTPVNVVNRLNLFTCFTTNWQSYPLTVNTVMSSLCNLQYIFKTTHLEPVSQSVSRLSRSCLMYVLPLGCREGASHAVGRNLTVFVEHFQTGEFFCSLKVRENLKSTPWRLYCKQTDFVYIQNFSPKWIVCVLKA